MYWNKGTHRTFDPSHRPVQHLSLGATVIGDTLRRRPTNFFASSSVVTADELEKFWLLTVDDASSPVAIAADPIPLLTFDLYYSRALHYRIMRPRKFV